MKKLSGLGEREIIARLSQELDIGDDAAWLPGGKDAFLIFSTDMLYERTHRLPGMALRQFGKLVVTVNLSDIAAMGATPLAFLLAYSSQDIQLKGFQEIIAGVKEQCQKFHVKFTGGDTNEVSGGKITLAGSILGSMKQHPCLRSTAQVGDLIGVTGKLGIGFAIDALLKGKKIPKMFINPVYEPQPRVREGQILGKQVNSLTDISDSLAVSLHCLAQQSGVGMRVNLNKLPLLRTSPAILNYALYGGGDYELLFTLPKKNLPALKESKLSFSLVGQVIKEQRVVGIKKGEELEIEKRGYEHFSTK